MIELSVIRDLVTIFGVIAGFSYYVLTVRANQRNQRQQLETRQTQLFMTFGDEYGRLTPTYQEIMGSFGIQQTSEGWSWKDYDDFMLKYGPDHSPNEWKKFVSLAGLYERMGVLAKEGSVNLETMYHVMGGTPIRFWDKFEEIIDTQRIEIEQPPKGMWFEHFEDLAYRLREIREADRQDLENRLRKRRLRRQEIGRTMPDYNP